MIFNHRPMHKDIVMHFEHPFSANLHKVASDIADITDTLSQSGFQYYRLSSPIFLKKDNSVRTGSLKIMAKVFNKRGYNMRYEVCKTPTFIKLVFKIKYYFFNKQQAIKKPIPQHKHWVRLSFEPTEKTTL